MRALLAKDLRLLAPYAWLIAPAHGLLCAQAFLVPSLYFSLSLAAACAWTVALLAIDWRADADRLLASLPVTRATIVRARYVGALAALAVGAALYLAYGHALVAVAGARVIARWHGATGWASGDAVAAFLLVGYLLTITFLPFVFRFGLPLGASWFSVAGVVAGLIAVGVSRLGFTPGILAPVSGAASGADLRGAVQVWLGAASRTWGVAATTMTVTGLAAIAGACSLALSIRFYTRKEL